MRCSSRRENEKCVLDGGRIFMGEEIRRKTRKTKGERRKPNEQKYVY